MEPSILYVFFFLAFFLFCIRLILSTRNSKTISNLQHPPGSTGLPVVGEALEYSIMGKRGIPEKFFMDRMNKYSNQVFKTSLMGEKTAVCCGASGNKFLFSNLNELIAFSWPSTAKKFIPHSGTTTKEFNDTAIRFRGFFLGFFIPDTLYKCVEMVDVVAKEHLKNHWDNQKQVNVLSKVQFYVFTVVCRLFLNLKNPNKIKELAEPFELVVAGIFSLPLYMPGTSYYRGLKATNAIRKMLIDIIRKKKNDILLDEKSAAHQDQDFMAQLLTMTDDNGKLSAELQVTDQMLISLTAGKDSTSSAITSTIKYLAEFPHVYDNVLKEQRSIEDSKSSGELLNWKDLQKLKYTWNVVSEVLRLQPPVQGNFREALADFNYSNFFIPKGWKLFWTPNTTHRNPEYFPEPETFDPSRFERTRPIPYAFVPFGGGTRVCPGKDIARIIILVFLYNVVRKFRWEKLIPDEKLRCCLLPSRQKDYQFVCIPIKFDI